MNRDCLISFPGSHVKGRELIMQTAFHEAGHAVAIYFHNQELKLPEVSFYIDFTGFNQPIDNADVLSPNYQAAVVGGGQVEALVNNKTWLSHIHDGYEKACDADIVNLIAGPLAEAKYVAQRDGEHINPGIVNIEALKNYGGNTDISKIAKYIDSLDLEPHTSANKLNSLFLTAFKFINHQNHWRAITKLAKFIAANEKDRLEYKEVTGILNSVKARDLKDWI